MYCNCTGYEHNSAYNFMFLVLGYLSEPNKHLSKNITGFINFHSIICDVKFLIIYKICSDGGSFCVWKINMYFY